MINRQFLLLVSQVTIALGVSGATLWARPMLSQDSKIAYFLEPPLLYQLIAISLVFVFFPQLLRFSLKILEAIAKECFLAYYAIFRLQIFSGVARLCLAILLSVSVALLLQSFMVYTFSIAREFKYHEEIQRQRLIERANKAESQSGDPEAAISHLNDMLRMFPDDVRNGYAERHIGTIEAYKEVSSELVARARLLQLNGSARRSIELYRAALDVWPHDKVARAELLKYRDQVQSEKAVIAMLYTRCRNGSFADFDAAKIRNLEFALRDPEVIARLIEQNGVGAPSSMRVLALVCAEPLEFDSEDAYFDALKQELFGLLVNDE